MAKQQLNSPSTVKNGAPGKSAGFAGLAAADKPASSLKEVKPAVDDIRRRAYELYCRRLAAGTRGTPEGDWQQAERELASK